MNSIKKWYIHRKWLQRYMLAYEIAIKNEDLHPDFYEHNIEYWIKQELKSLKQNR